MLRWIGAAVVYMLVLLAVGWFLMTRPTYEPKDLITLGAVAVAGVACLQAWRSATAATQNARLAKRTEELGRYGWTITLHPNGDHFVLRNTGTLAAQDVQFANVADFAHVEFVRHEGESGPEILPGQSKAFYALEGWSSPGTEILIDWQPEGEPDRKRFNEVLPPMPSRLADFTKERNAERAAEAAARERWHAETRRLLVELGDAWGAYKEKPSVHNKIRVQALVAALPGNFAKEIGYAVDVQRDLWGPDQWPLENFAQPRDRKLVRENAPMIELIWNLIQVQLPEMVEGDNSESPRYWYRIEDAVSGYVELVRRRESNKRELVEGPRDRKHREEAMQMLAQFQQGITQGTIKPAPRGESPRGDTPTPGETERPK